MLLLNNTADMAVSPAPHYKQTLNSISQVGVRWDEFNTEEHTQLAATVFALLRQGMLHSGDFCKHIS